MNRESFEQNIRELETMLYRVSKTILSNEKDCEDAVQETILAAYVNLDTLRHEEFFKTWITRILINECYKIGRQKQKLIDYEAYVNKQSDETVDEREDYSGLYKAIQKLSPKFRTVVVLYYAEEYSVEEIKEILSIPVGTVKSRLSSARKKLKQYLEIEQQEFLSQGGVNHETSL